MDDSRDFFRANHNFQKDAVKKWNPHTNEVTRSLFIGFVGLDKGKKDGAGTVVLGILIKGGTNGRLTLTRDCARRDLRLTAIPSSEIASPSNFMLHSRMI